MAKANISRDTFNKLKHYVGVRLQQGVPIVDADWNEQEDIRKHELRSFLKWFMGDGVPKGNGGFHIISLVGQENDFLIRHGICLVEGWDVMNEKNIKYTDQHLELLSAPNTGIRIDTVYLDVWEREVDAQDDESLVNPDIGIETCVRLKREWMVRVAENANIKEKKALLQYLISKQLFKKGHTYYPLASLKRFAGKKVIEENDITDLRRTGLAVLSKQLTIENGNVGIGTTNPRNKLDVEGNAVIGSSFSGTNTAPVNGLLVQGNVGIGTNEPEKNAKLHVKGMHNQQYGIKGEVSGNKDSYRYGVYGWAQGEEGNKFGVYGYALGNGGKNFGVFGKAEGSESNNYAGYFDGNVTIRRSGGEDSLRIVGPTFPIITDFIVNSNGNVGIGTNEPDENVKLHVKGKHNQQKGIKGEVSGDTTDPRYGVYGWAEGEEGKKYGVYGCALGNGKNFGVYGDASGQKGDNFAGYFHGNVTINQSGDKDSLRIKRGYFPTITDFIVKSEGNVGIGTETPSHKLQINGDLHVRNWATVGSDYAEYFESKNGKAIPEGTAVILENGKARQAKKNKTPIGIISANPGMAGGVHVEWPKKYLRDEFGQLIMEKYKEEIMAPKKEKIKKERQKVEKKKIKETITRTEIAHEHGKYFQKEITETVEREVEEPVFKEVDLYDDNKEKIIGKHRIPVMETYEEEIEVQDEKGQPIMVSTGKFETKTRPKINPEYDETKEYIPREKRPEWNCVGLLGQLPLRKGQPVADTWVKIKDISKNVELWLVK